MSKAESYLVFDAREASFLDLFRFLISTDVGDRKFIDCSEKYPHFYRFRRRWLIFVSIVIQKLLILLRKPLYFFGFALAYCLNLFYSNGGFFFFLPNLLTGKISWPEKTSATFASVIGHLDRRVEIDDKIERGSKRYKALLSIMASKLSYENVEFVKSVLQHHWQMELLGFYSCWNGYQKLRSTEVIVIKDTKTDPNLIVVSFRGTDPFDADDWCTDFDLSWYEVKDVGKIHWGFMKALGLQKEGFPKDVNFDLTQNKTKEETSEYAYYTIRRKLKEILDQNPSSKFILTGHSLGGALAILFAAILAIHGEEEMLDRLEGVYTFGQPRVGDEKFGNFMKIALKKFDVKYKRYVYCNDMVPRLPFDDKTLMFKHFGPCLYFDSFYKGKVEEEEPNKNYFNLLWAIPKMLNAVWELIRGLIIPYWKGQEYRESLLMKCYRLIGLLIPGLTAHCAYEYLNLTLLGDLPQHFQD